MRIRGAAIATLAMALAGVLAVSIAIKAGQSTPERPTASASIGPGWTLTSNRVGLTPFGLKCAELPEYQLAGHTVPSGTIIFRQRITTWLDLSMGNITISQSCIQPEKGKVGEGSSALTTWNKDSLKGPVVIEDSEYDGSLLTPKDQAYTGFFLGVASFYRNYVHHSGSGINSFGTYETTGADVVIQNNVVDDLIAYGDPSGSGNHQSGYTVRDFDTSGRANRKLNVTDNYFNCDGSNASGALLIQPNGEDVTNVTISGNLLAGNGFQLILEDDQARFPNVTYHNIRAINNRMLNAEYGPTKLAGSGEGWAEWEQNYIYDVNLEDGKGSAVPEP